MAVRAATPIEEYLHTVYEHDREYVHGEVVERGMPTLDHSAAQTAFIVLLARFRKTKDLHVLPELRIRLADDVVRIPDVAVYSPAPSEQIPTTPPLVAIEILSPDDRVSVLLEKCDEYHRRGVKHIWVVDPERRRFQVFDGMDLRTVPQLELPEADLSIAPAEIFE